MGFAVSFVFPCELKSGDYVADVVLIITIA